MRHGETLWNASNKVLGRTDIPLSDLGKRQALDAGSNLSSEIIDAIFTSPLSRAIETANIVSSLQNHVCPVFIRQCLIEQDFGIFEGCPRNNQNYQLNKRLFFKKYEKGESYLGVAARVYPFLQELKDSDYTKILIVTHGGICRILHSFFYDMDNEQFASYTTRNCEIKRYCLSLVSGENFSDKVLTV